MFHLGKETQYPKPTRFLTWEAVNVHVNVTQVWMDELCVNEYEGDTGFPNTDLTSPPFEGGGSRPIQLIEKKPRLQYRRAKYTKYN